MSVYLDALADEVFDAAAAQGLGEGERVRLPFGEVRRNPSYPDLVFLNGIAELRAPDGTPGDLDRVLDEHLRGVRQVRVSSRDPATIARLGPQLVAAGYEGDCRLAMVQVEPPSADPPGDPEVRPVVHPADWHEFGVLIGEDAAEHGWTERMQAQLIRLYRWQAGNQPQSWLIACSDAKAAGYVGLYQHGTVGYLHALFTRLSVRRQGVGRALVADAGRQARALGCVRLTLQCSRDTFLPGYYRALGFRSVGEMWIWTRSGWP